MPTSQLPIHKNDDHAGDDQPLDGGDREVHRHPPGRLARARPDADARHARALAKAGVQYIGDWVYDDEPTVIKTAEGPLVTLPYTVELNDIPMMIVQHHESDYLLKRAIDQFDRLYAEGKDRCKIMSLAIHPYISGQPHRIKYLEAIYDYVRRFDGVLHWNGAQILDWYKSAANVKFKNRVNDILSNVMAGHSRPKDGVAMLAMLRPSTPCFKRRRGCPAQGRA